MGYLQTEAGQVFQLLACLVEQLRGAVLGVECEGANFGHSRTRVPAATDSFARRDGVAGPTTAPIGMRPTYATTAP